MVTKIKDCEHCEKGELMGAMSVKGVITTIKCWCDNCGYTSTEYARDYYPEKGRPRTDFYIAMNRFNKRIGVQ